MTAPAQEALNPFIGKMTLNVRGGGQHRDKGAWIGNPPDARSIYNGTANALGSNFMPHPEQNPAAPAGLQDPSLENLLELARQAAQHSYSPYSHFRVGAALKLTNGEIVTGANVENVSYGLTICAERSALVRAVSQFGPEIRIDAVAVANLNNAPSPPCGACRQVLAEFILPHAPVTFPAADGVRTMPFAELLPLAFDMKLK
jgi:homotetrameric cytidine deaminase